MIYGYSDLELECFDRGWLLGLTLAGDLGSGRVALLLANDRSEPPREFRVLAKGLTATTKGPILFDDEAGKAVLEALADNGRDELPFDIGHGMLNPLAPPSAHAAAGWFTPAVRNGELWATSIAWTNDTAAALRDRKFRFFSPAIMRDPKTNRAVELINIALTNIPATKGQAPLMASAAPLIASPATTDPTRASSAPAPSKRKPMSESKQLLLTSVNLNEADRAALELLSDVEAKTCHLSGVTPTEFIAQKKRLAALDAENRNG